MGTALTLTSRPDWRMPRRFPILNWDTDVWTRTRPCSHATNGDGEPRCACDDSVNVDSVKIGLPHSILKHSGSLTPEERALINSHPEYSWSILRLFSGLEEASLYALHHHESMDGTGYPAGLKGNDIPMVSRIICVIDA